MAWQEFRPRDIDDLSKAFIGLSPGDRVAISSIYKSLATDGTNIDPDGAAFRDGVVVPIYVNPEPLSAWFKIGLDPNYAGPSLSDLRTDIGLYYILNDDGRVENLILGMDGHAFDLPMAVGCVEQLKVLFVRKGCKSISYQQLSRLPSLGCLGICSFELLHGIENLKSSSLEKMSLCECDIDDSKFETLLFDMLPTFPNISELSLRNNKIKSFRSLQGRLEKMNHDSPVATLTLCRLDLYGNPIEDLIEGNEKNIPEETAALCAFLRAFPTIGSLGDGFKRILVEGNPGKFRKIKYHPTVQHELIFNLAGRRLQQNRSTQRPLSLSVWPFVLARRWTAAWRAPCQISFRTYKRPKAEWSKEEAATGIYCLLRDEPDLFIGHNKKRRLASTHNLSPKKRKDMFV